MAARIKYVWDDPVGNFEPLHIFTNGGDNSRRFVPEYVRQLRNVPPAIHDVEVSSADTNGLGLNEHLPSAEDRFGEIF
jgi:hypothetical protein